jgi:hypothetical protein
MLGLLSRSGARFFFNIFFNSLVIITSHSASEKCHVLFICDSRKTLLDFSDMPAETLPLFRSAARTYLQL